MTSLLVTFLKAEAWNLYFLENSFCLNVCKYIYMFFKVMSKPKVLQVASEHIFTSADGRQDLTLYFSVIWAQSSVLE